MPTTIIYYRYRDQITIYNTYYIYFIVSSLSELPANNLFTIVAGLRSAKMKNPSRKSKYISTKEDS